MNPIAIFTGLNLTSQVGDITIHRNRQVASLSFRPLIILVFPVLHKRIKYSSLYEICTGRCIWRTKLEYLSSIVFHTALVAREYVKTCKNNKFGYIAIKSKTGVSIIDSISHCSSDKRNFQIMQNQNWSIYYR